MERSAIVDDYVRTGERITEIMAQLRASETYRADLEPYTDESRKPQAEIIERVLRGARFESTADRSAGSTTQGFDPAPLRAAAHAELGPGLGPSWVLWLMTVVT